MKSFFHRRYWPAWLTLVLGLAASGGLGWGLYRQAEELDRQRFKLEAAHLAALLESTMERYEERLARFADHCALFEVLPTAVWNFRSIAVTDLSGNLPNAMHAVYCLNIPAAKFQAHAERGRVVWKGAYEFDPQTRAGRDLALPVWHSWSRPGFRGIARGVDMAEESPWHPSLRRGLRQMRGGVSSTPVKMPRTNGTLENGFWFTLALFRTNQTQAVWQLPNESQTERDKRRGAFFRNAAIGILAVFISTDRMVDRSFNRPDIPQRLHVRLYASRERDPERLLNPVSQPPANPRHREIIAQSWYGERWALEVTSTPHFEAHSPRYRAWLVLFGGATMTLLSTALLVVALRARNRQESLTEQIFEARDALLAAEQQRQRLSHDLHDNTVQTLYAIQLGLGHTAQKLEAESAHAQRELSTVRAELDRVIAEIRQFITAEEKTEITADLFAVLNTLVEKATAGAKAKIELHSDPAASSRLAGGQAVQLANIAREALSNSLRHARPQQVQIALRSQPDAVCLEVSDDGIGFDLQSQTRGVGLTSMTTRTQEMGGTLKIQSAPGKGTRIVIRVPASRLERVEARWADAEPDES